MVRIMEARILTTFAWLLSLNFAPSLSHRFGDDGNDAPALVESVAAGVDGRRPSSAPPRLQHLTEGKDGKDLMAAFWAKSTKKPRIIFADSGVGGLSIMSKFIENFKENPMFKEGHFIFFDTAGLNDDAHSKTVVKLLDELDDLNPDLLFIACNGMSKVYLESDKAKDPKYPVIQMLPFAVEMWGKALEHETGSAIIQFVSEFTGDTYKTLLQKDSSIIQAIDEDRLVVQTCQAAISAIQDDGPNSEKAKKEITSCAKKAVRKLDKTDFDSNEKLFLGMGCTHFGWADKHWKSAVEDTQLESHNVEVLNPNIKMAQWLFDQKPDDLDPGGGPGDGQIELAVILRRKYEMDKIKDLVVKPLKDAIDAAIKKY
jgi:glutamate racemase